MSVAFNLLGRRGTSVRKRMLPDCERSLHRLCCKSNVARNRNREREITDSTGKKLK